MLNLVTASITAYDAIIENRKHSPTDFAIMAYFIKKCNDNAWIRTDIVTTITRLNSVAGSRTNYVKASLKRLQESDLIQVKRKQANLSTTMQPSEKICLKPGEKLQQLNLKRKTTTSNAKAQNRQKDGGDS